MKIFFHKNFEKQYKKLKAKERKRTRESLVLFLKDPFHPLLNNHPLSGRYTDYRSVNITGDLRVVYKRVSETECVFVAIDTHSNLYS